MRADKRHVPASEAPGGGGAVSVGHHRDVSTPGTLSAGDAPPGQVVMCPPGARLGWVMPHLNVHLNLGDLGC